jgi:hypothetical protein
MGVDERGGNLNVTAGVDSAGDTIFVLQQAEQVNLFVVPVNVIFLVIIYLTNKVE